MPNRCMWRTLLAMYANSSAMLSSSKKGLRPRCKLPGYTLHHQLLFVKPCEQSADKGLGVLEGGDGVCRGASPEDRFVVAALDELVAHIERVRFWDMKPLSELMNAVGLVDAMLIDIDSRHTAHPDCIAGQSRSDCPLERAPLRLIRVPLALDGHWRLLSEGRERDLTAAIFDALAETCGLEIDEAGLCRRLAHCGFYLAPLGIRKAFFINLVPTCPESFREVTAPFIERGTPSR